VKEERVSIAIGTTTNLSYKREQIYIIGSLMVGQIL
jgi:hypothetical protein